MLDKKRDTHYPAHLVIIKSDAQIQRKLKKHIRRRSALSFSLSFQLGFVALSLSHPLRFSIYSLSFVDPSTYSNHE
ncbi:hypothetical protein L1887_22829 [Cichorium endivia]|nr:hypothetical protein L1887_22829 [Cichorium endivia]